MVAVISIVIVLALILFIYYTFRVLMKMQQKKISELKGYLIILLYLAVYMSIILPALAMLP